jgi:hypothetical protein
LLNVDRDLSEREPLHELGSAMFREMRALETLVKILREREAGDFQVPASSTSKT